MGLQDELAAEPMLVVDKERFDAPLAELDRGRKPGRTAADDQDGDADGLDRVRLLETRGPGVDPGQLRQPLDRLDADPGPDELHAGLDRHPVGQDEALSALAVGAEDPLGGAVLRMVSEDRGCPRRTGPRTWSRPPGPRGSGPSR